MKKNAMTENFKRFLEEASRNEELKAKLTALTDKDAVAAQTIEIAKEFGFTLSAEDLKPAEGSELSPDELEQVAGGGLWDKLRSFAEWVWDSISEP